MTSSPKPPGFTLIEMAIVLVVIGLILGMVFKGKQLVDQSRVKKMVAEYNRILAAVDTFYDRYGFYPGDGCISRTPSSPMDCDPAVSGRARNGWVEGKSARISGPNEAAAFWHLLINVTGILSEADRNSVFGQPWELLGIDQAAASFRERYPDSSWLDLEGTHQSDARIACAVDQLIDDGHWQTGSVVTLNLTSAERYTPETDCWSLRSRQVNVHLRVLP